MSNSAPDAQLRSRDENPTYSSSPGVTPERPNQARKPSPSQAWSIPPRGNNIAVSYMWRGPRPRKISRGSEMEGLGSPGRDRRQRSRKNDQRVHHRGRVALPGRKAYGISVGFSPRRSIFLERPRFFRNLFSRAESEDIPKMVLAAGELGDSRGASLRLALRPALLRRNLFDLQRSAILPRAPRSD